MQAVKGGVSFVGRCSSRNFTTSSVLQVINHYEVLGVNRSATMAEIKAAYYRKSKECHPDLNMDSEAANQFRAITEAYEVLGNVHSKRLYDKGAVSRDFGIPDTPEVKFQKSRKNIVPTEGYSKLYDFDAWTQAHYSRNFKQSQRTMRVQRESADYESRTKNVVQIEKILYIAIVMTGVTIFILYTQDKDIDVVSQRNKKD